MRKPKDRALDMVVKMSLSTFVATVLCAVVYIAVSVYRHRTAVEGRVIQYLPGGRYVILNVPLDCYPVKGLSDSTWPLTALVSAPGSGNTWLRHLVQQAIGEPTGSIYHDSSLLYGGFAGEGVNNSSVVLVKTHEWGQTARAAFVRAILLIREPSATVLAEWNTREAGHRGHASNFGEEWFKFAREKLGSWERLYTDWLTFDGELHVVEYNELITDITSTVTKLVAFIGVDIGSSGVRCLQQNTEGAYHRPHKVMPIGVLNEQDMSGMFNAARKRVSAEFAARGFKLDHI